MDKLLITGGYSLNGNVQISGAKNAALPLLAASLLTSNSLVLQNIPALNDVATLIKLLQSMGVSIDRPTSDKIILNASDLTQHVADYELVKTMRASILVLGPLLARSGKATVSLPGGCAIGSRPIDQHLKGLQAMGAEISVEHGYVHATLPAGQKRLKGTSITTDMITVTGTENLLMAAVLAEGETTLENAAQEPEITDLANLLVSMGAHIEGIGGSRLKITGVDNLHGATHDVMPDRIETGTLLCAVAACGGEVILEKTCAHHLDAVIEKLNAVGAQITEHSNSLTIKSTGATHLKAQNIRTTEYPGFPTDMQAQFMALNCIASGHSTISETIFENRFMHVQELIRLGAQIQTQGNIAILEGSSTLSGATVMATDLRASACLVIAGLVAQGQTTVERIYHLDRGYDQLEVKLRQLGAHIERIKN